ncbi:hypothetical protein FS749_015186 [Ceratobasidium sp. UAMH 11750]|nr:hypothetical protein FS749_015186 [Ceratobasidium sp. UAMH 11750]
MSLTMANDLARSLSDISNCTYNFPQLPEDIFRAIHHLTSEIPHSLLTSTFSLAMKTFTAFVLAATVALAAGVDSSKKCSSLEVRKEWRALSKTERKNWIAAVNCLNKVPRSGKLNPPLNPASTGDPFDLIAPMTNRSTYYDELVYAHMNLNPIIHFTGQFLPWHRLYEHEWTNALRQKCGYKGVAPYWAWDKDAADFEKSAMWHSNPEYGLGSLSGDAQDDHVLKTGGLNISLAYPIAHKLRRRYNPFPGFVGQSNVSANSTFTPQEVRKLLATSDGDFTSFQYNMEKIVGMHAAIHLIMGGDMGTTCPKGSANTTFCPVDGGSATFSANEPMFHLHHSNVDRLWWLWQEKNAKNKAAFHGGSVRNMSALGEFPNGQAPWLNKTSPIPTAGMYKSLTIGEVMDTRSWPFCYVYQ